MRAWGVQRRKSCPKTAGNEEKLNKMHLNAHFPVDTWISTGSDLVKYQPLLVRHVTDLRWGMLRPVVACSWDQVDCLDSRWRPRRCINSTPADCHESDACQLA